MNSVPAVIKEIIWEEKKHFTFSVDSGDTLNLRVLKIQAYSHGRIHTQSVPDAECCNIWAIAASSPFDFVC